MLAAAVSMTTLGVGFGILLGVAARKFHVETPPIVEQIEKIMPGTNCGQCGLAGCHAAAEAVADGLAPVTLCAPGGRDLVVQLSEITGVDLSSLKTSTGLPDEAPKVAFIFEDHCTGCTKCFKRCPTDAIVGASKQIHTVVTDACTGCDACVAVCPTEAIILRDKPQTLRNWYWDKPAQPTRSRTEGVPA